MLNLEGVVLMCVNTALNGVVLGRFCVDFAQGISISIKKLRQ